MTSPRFQRLTADSTTHSWRKHDWRHCMIELHPAGDRMDDESRSRESDAADDSRRVHQLQCSIYNAAWSHGDLHLDNILYDSAVDRAVLIDFDTRHELTISATQRHCDDLKVVLLELLAMPEEQWRQPATAFLEEYADSSVLHELSRQLYVPRGFAKILWYTRTNCCSIQRLEPRLQSLRE